MRKHVIALTVLLLSFPLAACGDEPKDSRDSASQAAPNPETTVSETTPQAPSTPASPEGKISEDLDQKPEIPKPGGTPPTKLESEDIVKGKGKKVKKGDTVNVQYVGVSFSTGEEFDASWERGEPFEFTVGEGGVIPGWDQGLIGMKVGGRRKLTIPPELGYGEAGQPPAIAPNETLVFVIDLEKIG